MEDEIRVSVIWIRPSDKSENEELLKLKSNDTLEHVYKAAGEMLRCAKGIELFLGSPGKYDLSGFDKKTKVSSLLKTGNCLTVKLPKGFKDVVGDAGRYKTKANTNFSKMLSKAPVLKVYPLREDKKDAKDLYVAENVFSEKECKHLIEMAEKTGFEPLNWGKYRTNHRMIATDIKLAEALSKRLAHTLPKTIKVKKKKWEYCGLNERFRFCRYTKGQLFQSHTDTHFIRTESEMSFFTINIYLNGPPEFEGGSTRFYLEKRKDNKASHTYVPKGGSSCIFNHTTKYILHDGEVLKSGTKYLLRTDAMYKLCS
mmetsp:Transcript_12102/g.18035  ORF Transcript_12102/g.18035 Transcript_12102/m.18035 type:complete len:313 (+) Transcript_12102:27-965(+)|eukprot:CAMPEP_0167757918 /NCGR_PEP_ID=MMETSP0110_2-20121227/10187_1 /TAXON_ID=629695 /ORGANISM="Gymnochlora sp., Strain CCMP2014" /LENGTH=312 /DNA_ID=CAMNT_0007644151 /DNA_START=486 /DNA_END=1424 /DNA_ORIENTATION=+